MRKLLVCLAWLFSSTVAFAVPYQQMVYFGDSLTDNGNLYHMLKIIPTSPPYYEGRFSNGPTWAENVGDYYQKSSVGTLNYCVGGATAVVQSPIKSKYVAPATLEEEVLDYYKNSTSVNKSTVFYTVWIGANDYLYGGDRVDINDITSRVVDKTIWALSSLIDHGAKYLMVMNLPDLGRIPYARNNDKVDHLSTIAHIHNDKLSSAVAKLRASNPGVQITYMDVFSIFNDILDNTERYNQLFGIHITNTTSACWPGGFVVNNKWKNREKLLLNELDVALATKNLSVPYDTKTVANMIMASPVLAQSYQPNSKKDDVVCETPDEYLFWDQMHPTRVIHQVLAKIIVNTLEHGAA